MPIANKLGGIWSRDQREVTWQFEILYLHLNKDLWSLNFGGYWLQRGGSARKRLSQHRLFAIFRNKHKTEKMKLYEIGLWKLLDIYNICQIIHTGWKRILTTIKKTCIAFSSTVRFIL